MDNTSCSLPAVPVELFTILDNGNASVLVVCPVCGQAYFIESDLHGCNMPGDTNVHGEPIDRSPMELVCDECEVCAAAFIPERVLTGLLKEGHLEVHEALVRTVKEAPLGCLPPASLTTPTRILHLFLYATTPGQEYFESDLPEICRIIVNGCDNTK